MEIITVDGSDETIIAIHQEIRRTDEARYVHRLHAVLLVAKDHKCSEVAELLGDSVRAVQNWVNQYNDEGFSGLQDKERPGRPSRLNQNQLKLIGVALRNTPEDYELAGQIWDGKILSEYIRRSFGIKLGVRQCQRIFHQLGFRLKKPKEFIAGGDPELKKEFKKKSMT